eukprot:gene9022-11050_t
MKSNNNNFINGEEESASASGEETPKPSSSSSAAGSGEAPTNCPTPFFDDMEGPSPNMGTLVSNDYYHPYSCGLSSDLATFTSDEGRSVLKFEVTNSGCPTSCFGNPYGCAESSSTEKLTYGTYRCGLKASPIKGTISSCYLGNGGKGELYSDIYIRVVGGNESYVKVGFSSYGEKYDKSIKVTNNLFDYTNYTINYTDTFIGWYINKVLLHSVKVQWAGQNLIPEPPLKFFVSVYTGDLKKVPLPANDSISTFGYVDFVAYDPVPCSNLSSSDSNEQWHWAPGSPMRYFTTNCTNYRPQFIFNDTLQGFWKDDGWSFRNFESTNPKRRGEAAISFDLKENTGVYLYYNKTFGVKQHKFLSFWMNGGEMGSQQMIIWMTSNRTRVGSANLGDYVRGGISPNRWYKVIIPLRNIQINPPETKVLDGILFTEAYEKYMGIVTLDDVLLSNGSVCMTDLEFIYTKGKLQDGYAKNYSIGSVDFQSKGLLFRDHETIEWRVMSSNSMKIAMMNGTIATDEWDGIVIALYYNPDSAYQFPNGEAEDDPHVAPPRQIRADLQVTVQGTPLPPLGLAEYVGGEFPARQWVELSIPFYDLSCWQGSAIDGIEFKSDLSEYQGVLYIGRIAKAKFVPPHTDDDESSSSKLSYSIVLTLVSLLFLLVF